MLQHIAQRHIQAMLRLQNYPNFFGKNREKMLVKNQSNFRMSDFIRSDMEVAARRAVSGHRGKKEVIQFESNFEECCDRLWKDLWNGNWKDTVTEYKRWDSVNENNGKLRHIESPSLCCRIYQHLLLLKLESWYKMHDNHNGLNCKIGHGICSGVGSKKSPRNHSVVRKLKHIIFDRTDLHYALVIDQRKCYAHVHPSQFRFALHDLGISQDSEFVDFAVRTSFGGKSKGNTPLPIGTPTSPMVHHLIMKRFDDWVVNEFGISCRFADDNILFFHDSEEAQSAKWRIQNYWWYKLGIRTKSRNIRILDVDRMNTGIDFCGYVFHRNPGLSVSDHNKGFVRIRKSTLIRAMEKSRTNSKSYGSYFGLLSQADEFRNMRKLERSSNGIVSHLSNRIYQRMGMFGKTGKKYKTIRLGCLMRKSSFDLIDYDVIRNQILIRTRNKKIRLVNDLRGDRMRFIRKFLRQIDSVPIHNIPPIIYDPEVKGYIIPGTIDKIHLKYIA